MLYFSFTKNYIYLQKPKNSTENFRNSFRSSK